MANCLPFNSINADRAYKAEDWAWYFATFIGNGVFPKPSNGLKVEAEEGMTLQVNEGYAFINGYAYRNWARSSIEIGKAGGTLNRIDRIVLRWDLALRDIYIDILKGEESAHPYARELTRNAEIYELALADVYVGKGVAKILTENITDTRFNSSLCGIVKGTVEEIDASTLTAQFDSFFETYREKIVNDLENFMDMMDAYQGEEKEKFEAWVESVKNILNESAAGQLLNRIEEHEKDRNIHVTDEKQEAWDGKMELDGDSVENTVTFESGDTEDPAVWADVGVMESGEKHGILFRKISFMARNSKFLKKMLEKLNTDLSGKVSKSDVINNLISTDTDKPLSAAQGRALANGNANDSTARLALTKNVALINFSSSTIFTRFGAQYIVKIGKMAFVHLYFSVNATLEGNNIFAIIPSGFFPDRGISQIPLINVLDGSRGTVTFRTDGIIRGDTGFLPGNYCLDFSYPIA